MNYSRLILFTGIVFLSAGGAARWNGLGFAPFLFSAGGLCKISYIMLTIKSGRYKPGYEITLLLSGLLLLVCGIVLKHNTGLKVYSSFIITIALILKLIFVTVFIFRIRKTGNNL